MSRTLVGLLALVALLVAAPLMAQERQGRRGLGRGAFGGITKAALLRNENVQKELELGDEQKQQLAKIDEEASQGRRGGRGFGQELSPEERAKLMAEQRARQREHDKNIDAVLRGPQKTRLNEIYVQAAGTYALTNPEIAKELGIGEDLQAKITEMRQDALQAARGEGGFNPERFREIQAETDKKVLALLSAEQQAKFEKMKGKPASFDLTAIRRGGGLRRGGGNQ